MNRNKFQQERGKLHVLLTAIVYFFLFGTTLLSHAQEYVSNNGIVVGTGDSRLAATIVETENGVAFQVIGVGEMSFDGLEYAFFVRQDELVMSDKTFTQELTYGKYYSNPSAFTDNIEIGAGLKNGSRDFKISVKSGYHKAGDGFASSSSSVAEMDVLIVSLFDEKGRFELSAGEIAPIFTCYFKKKNPGSALSPADIGVGAKVAYVGGSFCPKWTDGGLTLTYAAMEIEDEFVVPELFAYRSPSSVAIVGIGEVPTYGMTLNGKRGDMSPANDLLEGKGIIGQNEFTLKYEGRLAWDRITQRGFIYTTEDVTLSVKEYSNILLVDGKEYPFPNASEMEAGKFTRGGHTFNIVSEFNSDQNGLVSYNTALRGLSLDVTYSVWPYIKYIFETSREYPNMGAPAKFITQDGNYLVSGEGKTGELPGTTPSEDIQRAEPKIMGYYNVLGVRLPKEPVIGVYIILYDDGTTVKKEKLKYQ